jgi:TldD protein
VRTQNNENTSLEMKDGQMEAVTVASEVGAGVRVLAKGAWGFSTTNSLLREDLAESLKAALKMASTAGKRVGNR